MLPTAHSGRGAGAIWRNVGLKREQYAVAALFVNHGVDGAIEWPKTTTTFMFGDYEVVAFPPSRENDASLHIDLSKHKLSAVEGMSVLSQILSIETWLDDAYAVLLDGWAGNPVPTRPARHSTSFPTSILDVWCNAWGPVHDDNARRALAIYREAINMLHFHSPPYAVLGFYKIIETTFDGKKRKTFLEREISNILPDGRTEVDALHAIGFLEPSPEGIADFLYRDGRQAVAHAEKDPRINPDDISQVRNMSVAALFLRRIARQYIKTELGVSTDRWQQ
jgi:hypothetical protein